ncbi:FAD-dependent monooxygenase [Micromonospora sp. NPDC049275]|uniref:FAD-dependent monooxygenase n=1 Tax=Micromonospora sp. NPDC049275 TaxID=3364268 RepID=UPI003724A3FF
MTKPNVLISGASVAGPALAYFLHQSGYDVTVVERAPALRDSGYAVDFRGTALDVLEAMGIRNELCQHDTKMRGTIVVDEAGNEIAQLPVEAFGGELEVPKRDLTRILHRITADDAQYLFDDSITALTEHAAGITVEFERHAAREFDLVFGADGVHSNVRKLAFGPNGNALRHLGMSGAGFSTSNYLGLDGQGLLKPGKAAIYLFSASPADRLTVSLSFATDSPALDWRTRAEQEQALRAAFAGHEWEAPRLLKAMSEADDFYFASSSQVHLDHWHRGRVALLGDAGYCAAPTSGMGTSQALVGAWALARELSAAGGHHEIAYTAYEQQLRPYVAENQAAGRRAAAGFGGEAPRPAT